MTWNAFHSRGEVLRAVIAEADLNCDGNLPTHIPGVTETFADEIDLIATLQLRWRARLDGNIERALSTQPMNLVAAVTEAWIEAADAMPGVRKILDNYSANPQNQEMAVALSKANSKDWALLAVMSGLSNDIEDPISAEVGSRIEAAAAKQWRMRPVAKPVAHNPSFFDRIIAALAA